jgi:hypothetical protein
MTNAHSPAHGTTGPLSVPHGGHYPAGWVSPEAHEAAQRAAVAQELSREQAEAEQAAWEQAITDRLAARRGALGPEPAPEPAKDGEFAKGLPRKA